MIPGRDANVWNRETRTSGKNQPCVSLKTVNMHSLTKHKQKSLSQSHKPPSSPSQQTTRARKLKMRIYASKFLLLCSTEEKKIRIPFVERHEEWVNGKILIHQQVRLLSTGLNSLFTVFLRELSLTLPFRFPEQYADSDLSDCGIKSLLCLIEHPTS